MKHGNLYSNDNRKGSSHRKTRLKVEMDYVGGGVARSSDEGAVMTLEQSGNIILLETDNNWKTRRI